MKQRVIGGMHVSEIGLGGLPMSIEGRPDEDRAIATIHAALDAGVTLIDTADAYHRDANDVGHNEVLIAKALSTYGDTSHVLVGTKGGHVRPGDGSWTVDGTPEHLMRAAKASARRLGVDAIGLYHFHRPDPEVDYADSVGAIRDLLDEGVIQMAGVSNADVDQIRLANDILGGRLVSVQNQFSPAFLTSENEMALCGSLGIAFLAWSPLGGPARANDLGGAAGAFSHMASELGVSTQRLCLAWELALAPHVIPIPGASRPESIRDSAEASAITLTPDQVTELSHATFNLLEQTR